MAQGEHFEVECRARLCQSAERQNKRDQQGCHRPESLSPVAGKFNGSNAYGVFRRHRKVLRSQGPFLLKTDIPPAPEPDET
jgi:hypothetical protein